MESGVKVQVMRREIVKPSSSEIDHPKKLKLSYLDQMMLRVYVPMIFFYEADESKGLTSSKHVQISKQLKQSLSNTLVSFYPLAGRVEGVDDNNTMVDCNDTGVEFIDARVGAQLVDVLKGPDLEDYQNLRQYYYLPDGPCTSESPFLYVQITFFDCGGIALGICMSHKLADCHSIMMFINAWASSCRSDKNLPLVSFDLVNYFPAKEIAVAPLAPTPVAPYKRTKMFVFDKAKIALLKRDAIYSTVKDPTRVEVISAFIWKFMLDRVKRESKSVAIHAVNLRGRKKLLCESIFGNCFMVTPAHADDGLEELDALVMKLRRSIRKIDDDYITSSQNGDTYLNESADTTGEAYFFSSWCRFPFYKVDFGFGNPTLFFPVLTAEQQHLTIFLLVSSKTGEDIQCWTTMEQHILAMLENQINHISPME